MRNEVWTDMLSFIKRKELAGTVSLTNSHIHKLCLPRLDGYKVLAHDVEKMIITSEDADDGWSTRAKLQIKDHSKLKLVPFANCPPPGYITGFRRIKIK
jgi:hypothetical protein